MVCSFWEHKVAHTRDVMTSPDAVGYRFAIIPITGRIYRLYTNMDLSHRLFERLYNGPKVVRQPQPETSISHSCATPKDGGAIAKPVVAVTKPVAPTISIDRKSVRATVASLAGKMGAKKISQHLLSQGIDMPMSTVKRYMREARNGNHV